MALKSQMNTLRIYGKFYDCRVHLVWFMDKDYEVPRKLEANTQNRHLDVRMSLCTKGSALLPCPVASVQITKGTWLYLVSQMQPVWASVVLFLKLPYQPCLSVFYFGIWLQLEDRHNHLSELAPYLGEQ